MIGRALGALGMLVALVCVGTVLAQTIVIGYLRSKGLLDDQRLADVTAVLEGADLAALRGPKSDESADDRPQVSLEDVARARALKSRDLELREQAMRNHLERVKYEQAKLDDENDRFNGRRTAFLNELESIRKGAIATNEENARLILESIKPKQAKEQILKMMDDGEMDDVVTLMSLMPIARRAKIVGEFKTPEEETKLFELLKRIREGVPEVPLIDATKRDLEKAGE